MSKQTPQIWVKGLFHRNKVVEFLTEHNPASASLSFGKNSEEIWLFKASERGGRTIARLVNCAPTEADREAVNKMINEEWDRASQAYKAKLAATFAEDDE